MSFDIATFSSQPNRGRAGRVVAYLVLQAYFQEDQGAFSLSDIEAALDLGTLARKQWSRVHKFIKEEGVLATLFDASGTTTGSWRMRVDTKISWQVNGQAARAETLARVAKLPQLSSPAPADRVVYRQKLNAEACELITSAERRYRSGAFEKALAAATELEQILDERQTELILVGKVRKLRILHRMNDWQGLETELRQLRSLQQSSKERDKQLVLHCLRVLYSTWKMYNLARAKAKTHQHTYTVLLQRLTHLLEDAQKLRYLRFQIEVEIKNLLILLRRRLLCEFSADKTEGTIENRQLWAVEAQNWSLETIEQTALHGETELMGNYCANYAYLLASFKQCSLLSGAQTMSDAFKWMTVSDRIAARVNAGSDNLWSPIYWLFLRRVCANSSWGDILLWVGPVVNRSSSPGPHLPNPTKHATCFGYVAEHCTRILGAQKPYASASRLPTQQLVMLLEELVNVKRLERIERHISKQVFDDIWRDSVLGQRSLTSREKERLDLAREALA